MLPALTAPRMSHLWSFPRSEYDRRWDEARTEWDEARTEWDEARTEWDAAGAAGISRRSCRGS
ncbi:hypothetical protein GCM10009806_05590 [Microbacterium flavum]